MAKVEVAASPSDFDRILNDAQGNLMVAHFWASWAPQCQQVNEVLEEFVKDPQLIHCKFVKVEAEAVPEVSQKYEVIAVPTCLLFKNNKVVSRVDGANVPDLMKQVSQLGSTLSIPPPQKKDLDTRLKELINKAPVMLFMKGSPDQPKCGFSRTIVGILNEQGARFSTFDILSDEEVRQGLKKFSNWPTYPQLYVNGELVGGLDIVKEMVASGEFKEMLPTQQSLEDRLKSLIHKENVMLFMKGCPTTPRCGFSRTMIEILNNTGVKYGTFDILSDEEVRQGLKTFSNWPTYPQLYVKGELIGGLDIVKELKETSELEATLKGQ